MKKNKKLSGYYLLIKEKYLDLAIIVILVIINIIIKSLYLIDYNIDLDEPLLLFSSQQTLKELFTIFSWENTPPLYYVIAHFWIKIFGVGVLASRFLPMLFSSLVVVFIYKIGKKYANLYVAIGASLLYTFSKIGIQEAHDDRVYSLLAFLTVASMYFYFSMIDSEKKKKYIVALTITNILLLYAHFLAFFIILLQGFYFLFISSIRKKILKKYLISSGILFLAYLPYLYYSIIRFSHAVKVGISTPEVKISYLYSSFIGAFCNSAITGNVFLIILIIFILIALVNPRRLSIYEKMILGWFFLLYLIIFLVSFKIAIITSYKYLILITPGFFLTIMIAINYLTKDTKFIRVVLILICTFLMVISTDLNSSHGLDSKHAVTLIRENKSDSTIVFVAPKWIGMVFTYHYNINAFADYRQYEKHLRKDNIFVVSTLKEIDLSSLAKASDVILLDGWNNLADTDPDKMIFKTLMLKFETVDTIAWNSMLNRKTSKTLVDSEPDKFKTERKIAMLKGYAIFHFGHKLSNKHNSLNPL